MIKSRLPLVFVVVSMSACAGRYRTEVVGSGNAIIQPRGGIAGAATAAESGRPWAVGGGIQLPAGSYDLALAFDVPRAQVVDWTVTCPGVDLAGSTGESFEQFRERRFAEIRAQRERDAQQAAAATNLVLGAVTPTVRVGNAAVSGSVRVEAQVDAAPIVLAPHDVGANHLTSTTHVDTTGDGVCAVTAIADDANVLGTYRVTRVRDLHAEAQQRANQQQLAALELRGHLKGQLIAGGASAAVRTARIDALAATRARAQAEAAARVQVRIDLEARARTDAYQSRSVYLAYLEGGCHADPNHRARQQDVRVRVARAKVDQLQLRLDMALRARAQLSFYMLQHGAIARPPMPAAIAEVSGPLPFDGARWTRGTWTWTAGHWEWRAGYWSDPDVFTASGGPDVHIGGEVSDGGGFYDDAISNPPPGYGPPSSGVGAISGSGPAVRDHRTHSVQQGSRIRDHRTHETPASSSTSSWTSKSHPDATVRDHRTSSSPSSKDDKKQDDDKKDSGGGRFVREHR